MVTHPLVSASTAIESTEVFLLLFLEEAEEELLKARVEYMLSLDELFKVYKD